MSDLMTFPDTVEEFMEQYKVTDTEQVYSNGAEYVPIFRMKQWFEHLLTAEPELIRCKDCKFTDGDEPIADGRYWCVLHESFMYFCSDAERRSDE